MRWKRLHYYWDMDNWYAIGYLNDRCVKITRNRETYERTVEELPIEECKKYEIR